MLEIHDEQSIVDRVMALKTHALTATLRRHIDYRVVVDTKVHLVADGPGETHGDCFILGDVTGTSASVLVMAVDEVEGVKEVGLLELLLELAGLGGTKEETGMEKMTKERHGRDEWLL
jgi:hypothetical protein